MNVLYITIGIIIGAAVMWWVLRRRTQQQTGPDSGITAYNLKRQEEKEVNKQKILDVLVKKNEITNDDVEELLNISDVSAYRYLEELEQDGKLTQIGKTGRSVRYRRTQ